MALVFNSIVATFFALLGFFLVLSGFVVDPSSEFWGRRRWMVGGLGMSFLIAAIRMVF